MPSFTSAAYSLLEEQGKPLSTHEITKRALARRLIVTRGKTPNNTMASSLYLENKRRLERGEQPRFKRYQNNLWGLTKWKAFDA